MNKNRLDQLINADEGNFYDTRTIDFEMDKSAAKDDYGLSRVPGKWRFSPWQAFWSLSGLTTGLAFPLVAALLTFTFGAPAVIIGFFITAVIVGFGVYFIAVKSANEGIGKDLIGRSSLGYFGSVIPSLFFAFFQVILFALEISVMANSLTEYIPFLPYWASALIITAAFVPIGIYGMVWINKLQNFTFWFYIIGIILAFIALFNGWSDKASIALAADWWTINPSGAPLSLTTILAATGAWATFGLAIIYQVPDVSRMVRRNERKKGAGLVTFISAFVTCVLTGLLGIFLLASTQLTNPDPGVTFVWLLGPVGILLVLITQVRVLVIDMYIGTLIFDSIVVQVSNKGFNRAWVLIPFAIIGYLMVMTPGFLDNFTLITSLAGVIFAAWVGAVFGETLLVRRKFGIPVWSEFRRAYLPVINWIGFAAMLFPAILGLLGTFGLFGGFFQAGSVLITLVISFFLPTVMVWLTGKDKVARQYFARIPEIPPNDSETLTCKITGETNHRSDFVLCPYYNDAWISSLACATESNCSKICQRSAVPQAPSNRAFG